MMSCGTRKLVGKFILHLILSLSFKCKCVYKLFLRIQAEPVNLKWTFLSKHRHRAHTPKLEHVTKSFKSDNFDTLSLWILEEHRAIISTLLHVPKQRYVAHVLRIAFLLNINLIKYSRA